MKTLKPTKSIFFFLLLVTFILPIFLTIPKVNSLATDSKRFANYLENNGQLVAYVTGEGLADNNLILNGNGEKTNNTIYYTFFNDALYSRDKLSQSDKNNVDKQCLIGLTLVAANNTPNTGTTYVRNGSTLISNGPQPCSTDVVSEAKTKFNNKPISIGRIDTFNRFFGANAVEPQSDKAAVINVNPVLDAESYDKIDESKVPKNDSVTLTFPDGKTITQTSEAAVVLAPPSASVRYQTIFKNLEPGNYKACSKILNNVCKNFVKAPREIARVDISGDSSNKLVVKNQSDQKKANETCETAVGFLGFIMCPVINMLDAGMGLIDSLINYLLEVKTTPFTETSSKIRIAWVAIRNLAYLITIPIMLVMVIGTALGFEVVSAYTVKKSLPRLVLAIVFISLSYSLCVFLINVSNNIGQGTLGLLTSPFGDSLNDLFKPHGGSLVQSGILGQMVLSAVSISETAIAAVAIAGLVLFFGSTILLFAAIGFLTLLFRQMMIVFLVLLAPLAILAWVFPGNDKLWKTWWSLFSKLLIMYPLIMALIAAGRIFAFIGGV